LPTVLPWNLCHRNGCLIRAASEGLRNLLVALATNLNHIAYSHHGEQLFHVAIAQPDASVRSRMSHGLRRVRAMNAIAFLAQPQPSRSYGIVLAARYYRAGVVVGGIGNTADDLKFARWTRAFIGSHCHSECCDDSSAVEHCEPAVWNADQHDPVEGIGTLRLSLRV
jgi:hypothetical protein